MDLTVFSIDNAKHRDRPYKRSDGFGLHLQVNPTGAKLWRFRYRFGGRANMLGLGAYPEISLATARERRDEARKLIAEGTDPSRKKRRQNRSGDGLPEHIRAIAAEHIQNLEEGGAASSTLEKNRWMLQDPAAPLAKRPVTEITAAEILDILKRVEKSVRRETARRLRGSIGTVFRFATQFRMFMSG
jgi:Arm DNA-binding domain